VRLRIPFSFIENNFLAGRAFTSWRDLNQRTLQRRDKVNSTYKEYLCAVPRELFAIEQLHLKPLPAWIPEVYRDMARVEFDLDSVLGLANLHAPSDPGDRNRVTSGVHRDITLRMTVS
jgi:hypothetical protein